MLSRACVQESEALQSRDPMVTRLRSGGEYAGWSSFSHGVRCLVSTFRSMMIGVLKLRRRIISLVIP